MQGKPVRYYTLTIPWQKYGTTQDEVYPPNAPVMTGCSFLCYELFGKHDLFILIEP